MPSFGFLAQCRWRALLLGPAGLLVVLACNTHERIDEDNFREDVIACEDALAKLEGCCPGFRANGVRCHYYDRTYEHGGCHYESENQHEAPALSLSESQCIVDRSCRELVDTGVCSRAQAALPYLDSTHTYTSSASIGAQAENFHQSHPPVCP